MTVQPDDGKTPVSLAKWRSFQETMTQPSVWRSWAGPLTDHAEAISAWVRSRHHDEIWFCGAGTSAFIGETLDNHSISRPGGARYRAAPTTDMGSCPLACIKPQVTVTVKVPEVSGGRSGNSSETLGTLDLLDRHDPDADRLNITGNAEGQMATRKAAGPGGQRLLLPQTNDQALAVTSSQTTMLLSAQAYLDDHPPMPATEALSQMAASCGAVLSQSLDLAGKPGAKMPSRAVFLGSGALQGSANECALKVLDLAAGAISTSWDTNLGFRHGPKAVVEPRAGVHILISGDAHTRRYYLDAANEFRAQFGPDTVLTLGPDGVRVDLYVPQIGNDAWSAVLYVVAAQILATIWPQMLGLDVENPVQSGSVRRVVDGVTIYPLEGE